MMERYTMKIGEKYYCSKTYEVCKKQKSNSKDPLCCCSCEIKRRAYNKLGEYEDLEEDGKLLKLPCKPGDTVYAVTHPINIYGVDCEESEIQVFKCEVRSITFYHNGNTQFRLYHGNRFVAWYVTEKDIGKTVFLTEQEALEALEEMRHE